MADRHETSAGGVVCRRAEGGVRVALAEQIDRVTGQRTTRLPKGKLEKGETPEQAAAREVLEETGLSARVVESLLAVDYTYRDGNARIAKRVHYYLMEWIAGEPAPVDGEMERVYWSSCEEAARDLSFETERAAVELAVQRLEETST